MTKSILYKPQTGGLKYEKGLEIIDNETKGSNFGDEKYNQTQRSINVSNRQHSTEDRVHTNKEKSVLNSQKTTNPKKFKVSRPQSSQNKPKMSPKLQKKVLENYEPQTLGDNIGTFENLLFESKERNSIKVKQSYDESLYIKPKIYKRVSILNNNLKDDAVQKNTEDNIDQELDDEDLMRQRVEKLRSCFNKNSKKIRISFGEYFCSLFWKSESLKEKLGLLNEGVRRVQERLDIFNVLKKFREVDKLKLLLLENEQYVLFDTLPNPELSLKDNNSGGLRRMSSFSSNQLKEIKFINEKRRSDLIYVSYRKLKEKERKTMIDEKLLEIYDNIIDF